MAVQVIVGIIVGLVAGFTAGLLARGRITLRCAHCRVILPAQCTDMHACAARRDGILHTSLNIGENL